MLIQKIFHLPHNASEARARLARIHALRKLLPGLGKAVMNADGVAQFDCRLAHGVRAHCVVVALPTPQSDQVLFKSTAGNIRVAGLIEFVPVRKNLTEVQLTIEYAFSSLLAAA